MIAEEYLTSSEENVDITEIVDMLKYGHKTLISPILEL